MASMIKVGDRVRVVSGPPMRMGRTGVVVEVSTTCHSTMNGGGFDCQVIFDNADDRMRIRGINEKVWREQGISEEYIRAHSSEATVRDNDMYVEVS